MKKIAPIVLLSGVALMTTASIIVGSFAWFSTKAKITDTNDPIAAVTNGAYFAYGNGTQSKPYGITKPRHLYNLAWLQYLDYFNKKKDGEGKIVPVYFELGGDVDGDGMVIPPIGDATHPFVGYFDGQGFVISNFVISNDPNDFVVKPSAVTSYTPSEIVGLFGVVGKLESDTTTSYYTATNTIFDTGITDLTIISNTEHTLAGMVAGYVNGTISNVAVNSCEINIEHNSAAAISGIGTDNLSDYGIVGYATTDCKSSLKKVSETVYDVNIARTEFVAKNDGATQGWGGSIDMKSIHERLNSIRSTYTTRQTSYKLTKTYEYPANGGDPTVTNGTTSSYFRTYTEDYNSGSYNNKIGAFVLGNASNTSGGNSPTSYDSTAWIHYLAGGHYSTKYYNSYYSHTGRPITDGTNYLTYNGSSLTNTTDSSTHSVWTFEANGSYYYIYTTYNNTNYYLYYNNGTLGITTGTGQTRRWQIVDSGDKLDIKYNTDTNYHLYCDNGTWGLMTPYYLIYDDAGHYMKPRNEQNGAQVMVSSTSSDSHWLYNSTNKYFYYVYNGNNRKMGYYDNSYQVQAWTDTTSSGYYTLDTGSVTGTGHLKCSSGYYVYYNGGDSTPWLATLTVSQAATMTVKSVDPGTDPIILDSSSETMNGPDSYRDNSRTTTGLDYSEQDCTYFPLNAYAENGKDGNPFEPTDNNTGYIIGGGSTDNSGSQGIGNVRIAYYSLSSYITNYSSSTHKLTNVLTYNDSGNVTINDASNNYEKYADSKAALESILEDSETEDRVYGLHFMDAQISTNYLANARYASINNVSYSNYKMPANSIDFKLKEKGFINFFAGTYGRLSGSDANVDAMFSIHMIRRSGTDITNIYEIEEVLSDNNNLHSYVYKIKNGGYTLPFSWNPGNSDEKYVLDTTYPITDGAHGGHADGEYHTTNAKPDGYSTVFKSSWITNTNNSYTMKKAYYYEIPMNMGEFCLGTVQGSTFGAYLMYLDIGANALRVDRTSFREHFIRLEELYEYPLGVALTEPVENFSITATNTALARIEASYSGVLGLDRNGSDVTITRSDTTASSKAKPCYADDSITLYHDSGGSTNLETVPKSATQIETYRLQYFDYNMNTGATVRTIITDTITTTNFGTASASSSTVRTIKQYDANGTEISADKVAVYNTDIAGVAVGTKLTNLQLNAMDITSSNDTIIVTFSYMLPDSATTITETLTLNVSVYQTSYYTTAGYTIVVTPSAGSITITIVTYNGTLSYTVKINGTTVTGNGQTIPQS